MGIMNYRAVFNTFLFHLKENTLMMSTLCCKNMALPVLIYKIWSSKDVFKEGHH